MELTKPKYKQTQLGLIPEDWEVKSILDSSIKITDGEHLTPKRTKDGYFLLSARNILNGKIDVSDVDYVGHDEFQRIKKRCNPESGDVLISCSGSIGRVAVVPENFECVMVRSAALVKPNYSKTIGTFIQYFLQSSIGQNQIFSSMNQGAQPNLFLNHIQALLIALPPTLEEQKAIATTLSDVDALINNLDQLITKKKAIKQGAMQQLLTPDENWVTKTIKEVATYRRGSFPQPYGLAKWYDDISGMPFVQVVDVGNNKKLKAETKQKISKEGAQMSVFVKKGSVILTIQGSIGRICITQYDAYVDRTLLIFESFKENFNTFFFMISIWLKFQIEKENAPGGIIKTITKEALSSFEISFPNRLEQDKIAKTLEDIDLELEQLETKKVKYQDIKQGMMQELLTGKTRLV